MKSDGESTYGMVLFISISRTIKTSIVKNSNSSGLGLGVEEVEGVLTGKGQEGTFWGDRNVPYLD